MNRARRRGAALAAAFAAFATAAVAQATEAAPAEPQGFLAYFSDNVLWLSVAFIFVAAVVGAILNARRRDRVLKSFDDFHATGVLKDGQRVWGTMRVFPNGVVLKFDAPYRNRSGNDVDSFIIYQTEYASVRVIQRVLSDLDERERRDRERELRSARRPSIWRRGRRWAWRQIGTLRDAILQTLTLILGTAKRATGAAGLTGSILTTQESRITQISGTVLGAVQLANDLILEDRIGFPVVVEVKEGNDWREITGMLKDYSSEWLEIWDARWTEDHVIELSEGEGTDSIDRRGVVLERVDGDHIRVRNTDERRSLRLIEMTVGTEGKPLPLGALRVGPSEEWTSEPVAAPDAPVKLKVWIVTRADLLLPRAEAMVRHGAPAEKMGWIERFGWRR